MTHDRAVPDAALKWVKRAEMHLGVAEAGTNPAAMPMNSSRKSQEHRHSENRSAEKKDTARQTIAAHRLRKHADYQRAYAVSRKRQSASMSWFLAPQPAEDGSNASGRVGLTAGKVLGKAHERNRIKRRMREVLRRHADLLPDGCDLIFHPRRSVLTLDFAKLEAEVVRILEQAKAEAARAGQSRPGQDLARPTS